MTLIPCPRCVKGTVKGPNGTQWRCGRCKGTGKTQSDDATRDLLGTKPTDYILGTKTAYPAEGILAGDSLIVRGADNAEPGQLVVTATGGEATVKRYDPDAGGQVVGLVIAVMRRLK
jgi:hypothetical protein